MVRRKAKVVHSSPVVSCQAGKVRAQVRPGEAGGPERGDGLLLEFRFARDPPTAVRLAVDGRWRAGRRLGPGRWWVDLGGVRGQDSWSLRWVAPAAGGALHSACFCQEDEVDLGRYDMLAEYVALRERFGLAHAPRDLRRFFLKLELVTATAEIQADDDHRRVAEVAGVEPHLLEALRSRPVDGLRQFLFARWRLRAVAHAAGADPRRVLPAMVCHQRTGEQVLALVLRLLHIEVGSQLDHDWLWDQVLAFGAGALRLDIPGERFNCQPNSAAFACFAELFALGCDPDSALEGDDLEDCRSLRVLFVSALEPYFDSYVGAVSRPRRIGCYRQSNLHPQAAPGEQRWTTDGRRAGLIREYSSRCPLNARVAAVGLPPGAGAAAVGAALEAGEDWLLERWGAVLERGLADEPDVAATRKARR